MYNITFQQIEAFLCVAKHLNMSRAAEELFVSQPTLSKSLQRFETGIGYKVFDRNNKGMCLTPQGDLLHNRLEGIYHAMKIAIDEASNIGDTDSKTLIILSPSTFDVSDAYNGVKQALKAFKADNPDVKVIEKLLSFDEMKHQIEVGLYDIVISHSFILDSYKELDRKTMNEYSIYLSIAASNPLAQCGTLPYDELSKMTALVEVSRDRENYMEVIEDNFKSIGITPKRIEPVDNYITLMHKLINDEGFSLCGKLGSDRIKHFSLEPELAEKIRLSIDIAWKTEGCSKETREFLKYLI